MHTAAVALGSNLGNRLEHVRAGVRAIGTLVGTRLLRLSSVIETTALVRAGDPAGPDFLNGVALIETEIEPEELMRALLEIERQNGREREGEVRWGARTLDLDLIFMGERVVQSETLTLPHPRLHERTFVLRPLAEVRPDWIHPISRRTLQEMLADLEQ